jgi:hypothetical protein
MPLLLAHMVFFREIQVFFNLPEKAYLEQTDPNWIFKYLNCKSFQHLKWFSQGNNMVEAAASNIDGFLWRDIYVSST